MAGVAFLATGVALLAYMLIYSLSRSTGIRLDGELLAGLAIGGGLAAGGGWIVWGNLGKDPQLEALLEPGNSIVEAGVLHRGTRRALMVKLRRGDSFPLYRLPTPPDRALEEELIGSLNDASTRAAPEVAAQPAAGPVQRGGVPEPDELPVIDESANRINISVLIFGSAARELFRACLEATRGPTPGASAAGELQYAVTELAPIRGWATHVHLYAIDDSLDGTVVASRLALGSTTVVLAQRGLGQIDPALYAMANKAREGSALLFVLAPREGRATLRDEAGIVPDHEADYDVGEAFELLKVIVKRVLGSLKKS